MIEATRCNKSGVPQSVPWSVGRSLSDVSVVQKSEQANQTQSEASKCVPEHSFAGPKLQSVGKVCLAEQQMFSEASCSFVKLHEDCVKLY